MYWLFSWKTVQQEVGFVWVSRHRSLQYGNGQEQIFNLFYKGSIILLLYHSGKTILIQVISATQRDRVAPSQKVCKLQNRVTIFKKHCLNQPGLNQKCSPKKNVRIKMVQCAKNAQSSRSARPDLIVASLISCRNYVT